MKRRGFGWLLAAALCWPLAHAGEALKTFEPDSFERMVAAHRGQAWVAIVWSTDCEYCLESFKTLEELRRKTGMPVVAIATDSALDPRSAMQVMDKVRTSGLNAQTWAFGNAAPERLRYCIDPQWRGEMPRSYWFDGHGKRVAYSGLITPEVAGRMRGGSR